MQKDYKSVSSVQPMVKSAVGSMASKRKISEDEDDASDSEKMVICEDESAGNGWIELLSATAMSDYSVVLIAGWLQPT